MSGVTVTSRRRGPGWVQLGYGIQMPAGLEGRDSLVAEITAWSSALPASGAFTGLTAARLRGLWLPSLPEGLPHFVAMGRAPGEVRPTRRGLHVTRHPEAPAREMVDGVPVTTVPEAILAAARFLTLLDLVVLIDSALQLRLCTLAELAEIATHRRRGAPALRTALPYVDGRSESAWETLLRLLHVVCGIAVEPQVELYDDDGRFVARGDLRVTGTSLLQEYDGADHRTKDGHARDLRRDRELADIGVVRRGYVAKDLLDHSHLILAAADRALGHERRTSPSPWLSLVAESCYSPAGRKALLGRVIRKPKDAGQAP